MVFVGALKIVHKGVEKEWFMWIKELQRVDGGENDRVFSKTFCKRL